MRAEREQVRASLRKHKRHEQQLLAESAALQEQVDTVTRGRESLERALASKVK